MEIIIESERDKRTYDWLLAQVGDAALRDACLSVTGKRRLYVSNLAKVLDLKPPAELVIAPREVAQKHLEELREILRSRSD